MRSTLVLTAACLIGLWATAAPAQSPEPENIQPDILKRLEKW